MERTLRVWACVLAGVVALTLGGAARGQDELATDAERLKHSYASELEELAAIVGLTEGQREAAALLYMEWARRKAIADKKIEAFYESVERVPSDGTSKRTRLYNDASRKQRQHRDKLRSELNTDLQTLLSDEQMQKWPLFERDLRRQEWLGQASSFTGAAVDLVAAVQWMKKDYEPSDTVKLILEEYKGAIDPAVRALEEKNRAWMEVYWTQRLTPRHPDEPPSPEEIEMAKVARVAQGVNLRYARAILAALEPEDRVAFEDRLYERPSYRTVIWSARERLPQVVMGRAQRMNGLDEAQRGAINETVKEFEERERDFKRRLFEACVVVEADAPDESFRMYRSGSEMDPKVEAVVKSGDELVAEFVERAKLILTKEQLEQLGPPFVVIEVLELNLDDED